MSTKQFSVGAILSVTTGKNLAENGFEGVIDIMAHIMNDDYLNDSARGAFQPQAAQFINTQHPWTKDIEAPEIKPGDTKAIERFLKEVSDKHGQKHEIGQISHSANFARDNFLTEATGRGGRG